MKNKLTFEESMTKLEDLVRTMESGEVSLEGSLKLFENGSELVKNCQKDLKNIETKVEKIILQNGEITITK